MNAPAIASLPTWCATDNCLSRVFTRTVQGTYCDDETLFGSSGAIRHTEQFSQIDTATPWVCEAGHAQPVYADPPPPLAPPTDAAAADAARTRWTRTR